MQVLIGVDIGTTSTKAIAFNRQGRVLASHFREYPLLSPHPGYSEQDPRAVFEAVLAALGATLAQTNQSQLAGISFSSAMHGLLPVDALGQPLTRCLIWADNRSQPQAEALQQDPAGANIYHHTGTPVHPMSPLCKLMWFREHHPELLRQTHQFLSIKEFVFFQFFGKYLQDYSLASATGLFDIRQLDWYAPALERAGIRREQLPQLVPTTHQETDLKPEYAAQLGLKIPVPFIIGASDGCLANLGAGATAPGLAALTIGTSGAVRVTVPAPARDAGSGLFSYVLGPGRYVVGGPVNNGGLILRWFRDQFGAKESHQAQKAGVDPYDLLLEKAAAVPPGAENLLFLPYLLGERAPIWDARARGLFFGISYAHTRAHFGRAVLEGILFGLRQVFDTLEANTGPVHLIYASGGFARSAFWVQLLADIFNKKVQVNQTIESSAWGAAVLGLEALGLPLDRALAGEEVGQVFLPDPERHRVYQKNFAVFQQLYPLLKGAMAELQG